MFINYHYSKMIIKEREKDILKQAELNRLIHASQAAKKKHRFFEPLAHYFENVTFPWFQTETCRNCDCPVT